MPETMEGGSTVQETSYPETCRTAVEMIASALDTDRKTAYDALRTAAALYDLRPSDEETIRMVLGVRSWP